MRRAKQTVGALHPRLGGFGVALLVLGSSCASCQLEKLQPGSVAMGVARLTIRQMAVLTGLISNDAGCGFASPAVLSHPLIQGQPGQRGAVTWTVDGCVLDFGELHEVKRDCVDTRTFASGRLTVSATKRVVGTLTGDQKKPVIPDGADQAQLQIHLSFDNLFVRRSNSKASLTNLSGTLDYQAVPYLAMSRSLGVCAVPTLDIKFSDVRYGQAKLVVDTGDRVFPVEVPSSAFGAQMGKWKGEENSLSGSVTVWDTPVNIPIEGDKEGLDSTYSEAGYFQSIACNEDLLAPMSYSCPSLKEQLVTGASRLSVKLLGTLASLVNADSRCGFASPAVLGGARLSGAVGGPGTSTLEISQPCTLSFPEKTALKRDCQGVETFAQGTVTATGSKTMRGVLSGNTAQPVVPCSRDPAEISLTFSLTDFNLSDSEGGPSFTAQSGTLSGTVLPRVGIDTTTGICSKGTGIAEFRGVEWTEGKVLMGSSGFSFQVDLSSTSLEAQSGSKGERTNYLSGLAISDGIPVALPAGGALPLLDPEYDPDRFLASFACDHFQLAESDEFCSFDRVLALNTARLAMQNLGAMASLVNASSQCGFQNTRVLLEPIRVEGSNGGPGLLEWAVSRCRVGQVAVTELKQDCAGTRSYSSGYAEVSANRIVTGERDTQYAIADSVIPRTSDAVTITVTDSQLTDFTAYSVPQGASAPAARLLLHSGRLLGKVVPAVGERRSKPGVFDVPTPVATFSQVRLIQAYGTLEVAGMSFGISIPTATLEGQNGSLRGKSNFVQGTVTLGSGATVTLPSTPLNPSFDQATFDQSYSCTPDLKATLPPN